MKLRARLFLTHVGLTAVGMVLMAALVLGSLRAFYLATTRADLGARASALTENVADWLEQGNLARVRLIVDRYGAQDDVWLRVIGADGALLASSSLDADRTVRDWRGVPGVAAALAGRAERGIARGAEGGDDRIFEALPIARGGRRLGVLRISRSLGAFQTQLRQTIFVVMGALFAALALCAAASFRLAHALAAPIRAMRDFAVAVGHGRFGAQLPVARRDELGELAGELNRMSARLAAVDGERRAFLANASHELRTPVTNVSTTLEALESGAADDPALRAQFLATALDETRRMSALVETLLDLGKLEAGADALEPRPVHVGHALERAAAAVTARGSAAGVALRTEGCDAWINGDPERLQRALLNVLDNALAHAPAGSTVHVRAQSDAASVRIVVRDEGRGFAPEELPRVFEQFYASPRRQRRGGSGLGLAIARRIVEAHHGTITAANAPTRGAVLTLEFPRGRPPGGERPAVASGGGLPAW